jgi:isopenicillin-N N-acyltransferase like protein
VATVSALRIVPTEGSARERGRTVGLALGDLVHRSLAFYRELFAERGVELESTLAPYLAAARRHLPEHVTWLEALAGAAEVPAFELFAVNAYEELEGSWERCSTFVVATEGATLLGHNEMWLAGDAGNVALVVERPSEGVPVVSPTIACCLPAVGMNGHGVAQGIDSLTARDDRVGIPRVLVSRHALEASDPSDAHRRATLADRAGGYAHVFAFPNSEALIVETSAEQEAMAADPRAHTNHYLDVSLAAIADPPSASSAGRYARLCELLGELRPATPEDGMEVLRQEAAGHANEEADTTVVFSMLCEVESGRMWVAPGDPSATAFEEVDLEGVLA